MPMHLNGDMDTSIFLPFDQIKPAEIISQYSEWIYFTIILVFFISISGLTLRRHFDKPYVKPLIISVALMLTIGVFKYRWTLSRIFEGWGVVGAILLSFMAATIPYGLCRGFGLSGGKAFYLTYILFYILAWVKYPQVFHSLGDANFGLINLGLLVLFLLAIYKVVSFKKGLSSLKSLSPSPGSMNSHTPEINQEIGIEKEEEHLLRSQGERLTEIEIETIEDIKKQILEILRVTEAHRNNLPEEERNKISQVLSKISKDEKVFFSIVERLRKLFQKIEIKDEKQIHDMKKRLSETEGKERKAIKAEIEHEEEKRKIEKELSAIEDKLKAYVQHLNGTLNTAIETLSTSPYPYDAINHLKEGYTLVEEMMKLAKYVEKMEERVFDIIKKDERLFKKEKNE